MRCEKYETLLSQLADGELSTGQELEVHRHISSCPECRTFYEWILRAEELLRFEHSRLPLRTDITSEVLRRLSRRRRRVGLLVSVSVLCLIVSLIFFLLRGGSLVVEVVTGTGAEVSRTGIRWRKPGAGDAVPVGWTVRSGNSTLVLRGCGVTLELREGSELRLNLLRDADVKVSLKSGSLLASVEELARCRVETPIASVWSSDGKFLLRLSGEVPSFSFLPCAYAGEEARLVVDVLRGQVTVRKGGSVRAVVAGSRAVVSFSVAGVYVKAFSELAGQKWDEFRENRLNFWRQMQVYLDGLELFAQAIELWSYGTPRSELLSLSRERRGRALNGMRRLYAKERQIAVALDEFLELQKKVEE